MATKNSSADIKSVLGQLESFLDLYFGQKAPALPGNVREIIVKYSPYLAVLMMLLLLPAILFAFGFGALFSPFAYLGGIRTGFNFSIGFLFALATIILQLMAVPGLFKRARSAWNFMFYATLLSAVYNLISLNIGSLVINSVLSLYILFQIRSYYK